MRLENYNLTWVTTLYLRLFSETSEFSSWHITNWRKGNKGVLCSSSQCSVSSVSSKIDIEDCNLMAASLIFTRTRLESNISGFGSKFEISSIRDSICRRSDIRLRCKGTWCWQLTAETIKSELIVNVDWILTDWSRSFSCKICKVLLEEYHTIQSGLRCKSGNLVLSSSKESRANRSLSCWS